jgi:hypothetical protein
VATPFPYPTKRFYQAGASAASAEKVLAEMARQLAAGRRPAPRTAAAARPREIVPERTAW